MSKYKVVPAEPTQEMVDAAADAYMPFGDMDIAIRMAILAAPDTGMVAVPRELLERLLDEGSRKDTWAAQDELRSMLEKTND